MDLPDLLLLLHYQLLQDFLLFPHYRCELNVDNLGVQFASHQGGSCNQNNYNSISFLFEPVYTFIFLDKTSVDRFGEFEVFTEALLLEITNSELISECEEMMNSVFNVIVLKQCHQSEETEQLEN